VADPGFFLLLHHVILDSAEIFAGAWTSPSITPGDIAQFLSWAPLGNTFG
jgi:hypothetical protein